MRVAAAWAWRLLIVGVVAYVILVAASRVALITFAVLVALLLAALLSPATEALRRWGFPRALATIVVFVGGIAAVAGIITLLVTQLLNELPNIAQATQTGIEQIQQWLVDGPLGLATSDVNSYLDRAQNYITDNASGLTSGAVGTALAVGEFTGGIALALFATFFFLYDGRHIWAWTVRLFPQDAEHPVDEAGRRAWTVLTGYVRSVVVIAAIDAIGIGIWLAVLGVPLAVPLGILVFFGAFVPLVGAVVTGSVAVLVALVLASPLDALLVLAGILVVQQIEGNLLQPLIMSRFVKIHPLAVALAVTAGAILAGIGGAIIAVPIVAVANTVVGYLHGGRQQPAVVREASGASA